VVVNWAGITHWNSVGLGGLIRGETRILGLGGRYWNCAPTAKAKYILSILKPVGFAWNLVETEAEAVGACPEFTKSGD
jgi:hypothetical protein